MKSKNKRTGFSLVELLTVMSIIVVLMSLLLPALTQVRRYSKVVLQKNQFRDIGNGMEMFGIDFDGYPESYHQADEYCGAMKLCEAMVGQDGMGFHPDSVFRSDGRNASDTTDLYQLDSFDPGDANQVAQLRQRMQHYIDIDKNSAYHLEELYEAAAPFDPNVPAVLSDVFLKIRGRPRPGSIDMRKLGMPVLYYKANVSKIGHDPTTIGENTYDYMDNSELVNLEVYNNLSVPHPMSDDEDDPKGNIFYKNTRNKKFTAAVRPYNENTYILISAGWDGLYGTRDDVFNFSN